MIPATQLRVGNIVLVDGELQRVTGLNHVTPGKGRGMMFVKLNNIKTGANIEKRFRSGEKVDLAMVETRQMEFLYSDGSNYSFMDLESYETVEIDSELIGDGIKYLKPNMEVKVQYHETTPIGIELPMFVELEVIETEPPLKGATASGSPKSATLDGGIVVKVPQFIKQGEVVRIDTRDNSFIERVN
ncbi:MAG: elongation factor P [Candidatus Hydrogenedentes bacterium]|nr:elongation factor P [Candidatus Hydrogenedentota bacterium]